MASWIILVVVVGCFWFLGFTWLAMWLGGASEGKRRRPLVCSDSFRSWV